MKTLRLLARPGLAALLILGALAGRAAGQADTFVKPVPQNLADLRKVQQAVHDVLDKVIPATVAVIVRPSQGSGVIVKRDGKYYVLTAGHVSGRPDRTVTLVLPDGKRLKGRTLGRGDRRLDSGLIEILDRGTFPAVTLGDSSKMKEGDWCVAVGHPGGRRPGRPPVARVGRLLDVGLRTLRSDCSLVGGDSGGPLFDIKGRLIGIHSRIQIGIDYNFHVPVNQYTAAASWKKLSEGEPLLGLRLEETEDGVRVAGVVGNGPSDKGGVQVDDVVLTLDGKRCKTLEVLRDVLGKRKPGDEVTLLVKRDGDRTSLTVKLGWK